MSARGRSGLLRYNVKPRSKLQYRLAIIRLIEEYARDPVANASRLDEIEELQHQLATSRLIDRLTRHRLEWVDTWTPPIALSVQPFCFSEIGGPPVYRAG
jgi:hypothetical protein